MKTPLAIVGVLTALIVGLLVHVINTASTETINIVCGMIFIIPVGYLGIKYRIKAIRDERLVANGLNHYREHVHHRRLVKKTS